VLFLTSLRRRQGTEGFRRQRCHKHAIPIHLDSLPTSIAMPIRSTQFGAPNDDLTYIRSRRPRILAFLGLYFWGSRHATPKQTSSARRPLHLDSIQPKRLCINPTRFRGRPRNGLSEPLALAWLTLNFLMVLGSE